MKNLRVGSKEFKFFTYTGEVVSQGKFSETHVSGGGGGGSHGNSRPVSISSSVVTNHEFWIKTDDGKEISVQLSGHDIPLREGQRITMVYIKNIRSEGGYPALLINHTADEYWRLVRLPTAQNLNISAIVFFQWASVVALCILPPALFSDAKDVMANSALGAFLGVIVATIWIPKFMTNKINNIIESQINPHLDIIAKNLLKQGNVENGAHGT